MAEVSRAWTPIPGTECGRDTHALTCGFPRSEASPVMFLDFFPKATGEGVEKNEFHSNVRV